MERNRLRFAWLVVLCLQAAACADDVGKCIGADKARVPVVVNNVVMYAGQAIVNHACTTGCHASSAQGETRRGVPGGLDFDLLPVNEEDAAGQRTNQKGDVVVKLRSEQIAGLRARQQTIFDQRDAMWTQLQHKLMPPVGEFESVLSKIFMIESGTECGRGKAISKLPAGAARETVRNWLACGAPLVESNGTVVEKSRALGTVGYQYPMCSDPAGDTITITLETLVDTSLSSCSGCHPGLSPPNLSSVDDIVAAIADGKEPECGGKPYVTPGDPDNSFLLDILTKDIPSCKHERMPLNGPYLSAADLKKVSDWIAAGAPVSDDDVMSPAGASDDASDDSSADSIDETPVDKKDAGTPALDASAPNPGKDAGRDAGKDAGRAP